jgi:glycosyltransferase involved in cell wall biosynthesis
MVIVDSDGQHNPDDIPYLIKEMLYSKADIVIGSRFVNGNGKNQHIPAYRKLGMKVLDTATNASVGLKVSDSQSGFRAYSRNAINCITLTNSDMGVGSEILIRAAENSLKISEVPIKVRYDLEDTSSKNPISHGFGVLNNIIGLVSQKRPMLFFCIPGALLMGIGTICVFMFMTIFNSTHNLQVEYGIGAALFIILGMLFISTGLMLASIQSLRNN